MSKRVMLKNVRLAFPDLNTPKEFTPGDGKPRFGAAFLFPKDNEELRKKIIGAMLAAATEKWGEAKAKAALKQLMDTQKVALNDGDHKPDLDGYPEHWYVSANAPANAPPRLLDRQRNELARDTSMIYAGCYVNASVEFWAQDNQWGKRINASLRGVQFFAPGDAFSAAAPASVDEFDEFEDDGDDDDFDI